MPICKKCNSEFPNSMIIEGKKRILNSRKYCLECSPFGEHNTRKIEVIDIDNEEKCICEECIKPFIYSRKKGGTKKICGTYYVSRSRRKKKQIFVNYKGGDCQICGYNKCNASLEFHHINPKEKEIDPTKMLIWNLERAKPELDKCILVCSNCHGEIHTGLHNNIDLNLLNISIEPEIIEKEIKLCEICNKEIKTKNKQKTCSIECGNKQRRKFDPTKEELEKLVWEIPTVKVAKLFGVSDKAIEKRCELLNIEKPKRGYWIKLKNKI